MYHTFYCKDIVKLLQFPKSIRLLVFVDYSPNSGAM